MVKDLNLGVAAANPSGLTSVDGTLFFKADDGIHGRELWKTDGTAAGTVLVADTNPGSAGSFPPFDSTRDIVGFNGMVFFAADGGVHGVELWRSDGTEAGTVLVADINPGPPAGALADGQIDPDDFLATAGAGLMFIP
jgi:ELWxxDGT repeat protein